MSEHANESFRVARWVHHLGGLIERHRPLCLRLADAESRLLHGRLKAVEIRQPIYVSGLARAGTTMLLEVLARHPDVATHQYRDFPPVFFPYAWNWLLGHIEARAAEPVERPHGDGILITPASPEAMEEVLWMAFFARAHDPEVSAVLDRATANPAFEAFYRAHIAKLLLARGGTRYGAKANYNVTRLEFIQKIYPDARFIVPVRRPETHVASLMRQHRLFSGRVEQNPRAAAHLRRVGHFEFGPDRRPINAGDTQAVREIQALWSRGEELRGWARYWAMIYGDLANRLDRNRELRAATLVLRFEDFCTDPAAQLERLFDHARLENAGSVIAHFSGRIRAPDARQSGHSAAQLAIIREETEETAARFAYPAGPGVPDVAAAARRGASTIVLEAPDP
jgi:hypothetical protein